jgi:hypothetical protein
VGNGKRTSPRLTRTEARAKAERKRERLVLVLGLRPNPCEVSATFFDPEVAYSYRYADCPGFDRCLDVACIADWAGLSCRACPVFELHAEVVMYPRIRRVIR